MVLLAPPPPEVQLRSKQEVTSQKNYTSGWDGFQGLTVKSGADQDLDHDFILMMI